MSEESCRADLVGRFIFGLAKQRLATTMWSTIEWLGRLAAVARPDLHERILQDLRGDYENFLKLCESRAPFVKRMARRPR